MNRDFFIEKNVEYQRMRTEKSEIVSLLKNTLSNVIPAMHIDLILSFTDYNMNMFGPLQTGVITCQGSLTGVSFHEEDLVYSLIPEGKFRGFTSNWGERYADDYKFSVSKEKKSNKGRKKVPRVKKTRATQGNGRCFGSSVQMLSRPYNKSSKEYKIKVSRTGTIGIPGVLNPDLSDGRDALKVIIPHITNALGKDDGEVKIESLRSVMRNYLFKIDGNHYPDIKGGDRLINLRAFFNKMVEERKNNNSLQEVIFNPEKYMCVVLKYYVPDAGGVNKITTINTFKSGKINISTNIETLDGPIYFHNWMENLFIKNYHDLIYTYKPYTPLIQDENSSDDEKYLSETTESDPDVEDLAADYAN